MPVLDPGRARTRPAGSGRDGRTNMAGPSAAVICSQAGATRRKCRATGRLRRRAPGWATAPIACCRARRRSLHHQLADCLVHALFNFVKVHKATNSLFVRELGRTPMRSTGRQIGGGFTNQSAEPDQRGVLGAMLVPLHGLPHRRHAEGQVRGSLSARRAAPGSRDSVERGQSVRTRHERGNRREAVGRDFDPAGRRCLRKNTDSSDSAPSGVSITTWPASMKALRVNFLSA